VVVALDPVVADVRDADAALQNFVDLALVEQLRVASLNFWPFSVLLLYVQTQTLTDSSLTATSSPFWMLIAK
jgi:hypothetical protein